MTEQTTQFDLAKVKTALSHDPTATLIAHLLLATRDFIRTVDEPITIENFKRMNVDEIINLAIKGNSNE